MTRLAIAVLLLTGCVSTLSGLPPSQAASDAGYAVASAWDARADLPVLGEDCRRRSRAARAVVLAPEAHRDQCHGDVASCVTMVQTGHPIAATLGFGDPVPVLWTRSDHPPRRRKHARIHEMTHAVAACQGMGRQDSHADERLWVHAYEPETTAPPDVVEARARRQL